MKKIFLVFFVLFLQHVTAQENQKTKSPDWNTSIEQQFKEVYTKSGKYQEYKVIKTSWFNRLRKHVNDSISSLKKQMASQEKTTRDLQNEIENLNNKIAEKDATIKALKKEKDSIQLFGMDIKKSSYNFLLWFIIAVLALALAFFIYRFLNSHAVTKETLEKYQELSDEYQAFRTRSLEREQSLKRKLIDEINKHNS